MFVNCPHCQALIAVDAVTGTAPEHCPYCDVALTATPVEPHEDAAHDMQAGAATEPDEDASLDVEDVVHADSGAAEPDLQNGAVAAIEPPVDDDSAPVADTQDGTVTSSPPSLPAAQPSPPPAPTATKRRKRAHPSFAKRPAASDVPTQKSRWPWPLAAALLLLLLLQLVIADRASLAASPRWRAAIGTVCNVLNCDIPPWREVGAFTMLTRDVQAHPGIAGALRIRAAFRNDARWPQPWPQLVVTLSDASGRVTGSRTFTADEYLGDAPTQNRIATGQTAAVALEIREPAPDTVSFSFDFR